MPFQSQWHESQGNGRRARSNDFLLGLANEIPFLTREREGAQDA